MICGMHIIWGNNLAKGVISNCIYLQLDVVFFLQKLSMVYFS